ncbi:hypothetical protein [Lysobacter sp. D1-1-M9]|uniref:hypothetical protein n=1 Tax=Novilysobacter longmucuonensis TaxID=3098603 RepID=UPI002FCAF663
MNTQTVLPSDPQSTAPVSDAASLRLLEPPALAVAAHDDSANDHQYERRLKPRPWRRFARSDPGAALFRVHG